MVESKTSLYAKLIPLVQRDIGNRGVKKILPQDNNSAW